MLSISLLALAWTGQALAWTGKPLAYVTNSDGISVIDTGDNKVVDTIPIRTNARHIKHKIRSAGPKSVEAFAIRGNSCDQHERRQDRGHYPPGRFTGRIRGESKHKLRRDRRYAGWKTCLCNNRALFE
jgi:YVTN family beta-propeller protein